MLLFLVIVFCSGVGRLLLPYFQFLLAKKLIQWGTQQIFVLPLVGFRLSCFRVTTTLNCRYYATFNINIQFIAYTNTFYYVNNSKMGSIIGNCNYTWVRF